MENVQNETNETKTVDMSKFEELVNEVAQLPEREQEKIAFFAAGIIAANQSKAAV